MKIQHKISLVSSALFGTVFLVSALVIYWAFDKSSKNIFYGELARTAQVAGMFYLEEDELTKAQFQPIAESFYNLSPEQKISIYDEQDSTAFGTETNKSKTALPLLNEIRAKGTLNFKNGTDYYHGLFYRDNQGDFVVLVKAQSQLIQGQLKNLMTILLVSFLVGMTVLIFSTYWLAKLAYKPVRDTIEQVDNLDLNHKPLALDYPDTDDDLAELFRAFNGLLYEIEKTYEQQKNFVDYASHELKTPLANIINHSEISLKRERSPLEYQETTKIVLDEAERLQGILKNLLTFSSLNRVVHQKTNCRIDELVWQVVEALAKEYGMEKFKVELAIAPEDFELLQFVGNETLLSMAIHNFMENAAKFSAEEPVVVRLEKYHRHLRLSIEDFGVGIAETDLPKIQQAFYRGANSTDFKGNGLGISIGRKVLDLHYIDLHIESELEKGTQVILDFPQTTVAKKEVEEQKG